MNRIRTNKKISLSTIITVLLAIIGIVIPIILDHYNSTKNLTLAIISKSTIISPDINIEGLEIKYKGESLQELSKIELTLENTGSKPIVSQDIFSPVELTPPDNARILDAFIESIYPKNLGAKITKNDGKIQIIFTLMNPGDRINISLLYSEETPALTAETRIAGINELKINELQEEKPLSSIPIITYPVGIISGFILFASIFGLSQYASERKIKKEYRNGSFEVPNLSSIDEWDTWIENKLNFITRNDRKKLLRFITTQENQTGYRTDLIHDEIGHTIENMTSNLAIATFLIPISIFGLYYSASNIGII